MLMRLSLLAACFVLATASPSFAAGCLRLPYQFVVQVDLPPSGSTPTFPTVQVPIPGVPFEIRAGVGGDVHVHCALWRFSALHGLLQHTTSHGAAR